MIPSMKSSLSRVSSQNSKLKNFFTVNDIAYQLVPPHFHRRNATERAIGTFKENFLAGLSSVDPAFPLHLWDRLLPQAEITLNLLRTSRLHPQLSAAAHFLMMFIYVHLTNHEVINIMSHIGSLVIV
jgi:hypothetical protein